MMITSDNQLVSAAIAALNAQTQNLHQQQLISRSEQAQEAHAHQSPNRVLSTELVGTSLTGGKEFSLRELTNFTWRHGLANTNSPRSPGLRPTSAHLTHSYIQAPTTTSALTAARLAGRPGFNLAGLGSNLALGSILAPGHAGLTRSGVRTGAFTGSFLVVPGKHFGQTGSLATSGGGAGVRVTSGDAGGSSERHLPVLSMHTINRVVEEVLAKKQQQQQQQAKHSTSSPTRHVNSLTQQQNSVVSRTFGSSFALGSQRLLFRSSNAITPFQNLVSIQPTEKAQLYARQDQFGLQSYFASAISLKTSVVTDGPMLDESMRGAIVKELRKEVARPQHKKDYFYAGSMMHVNELMSTTALPEFVREVSSQVEVSKKPGHPINAMLRQMFDLSILQSATFNIIAASSVFAMIGYLTPYQFLKDNAQDLGFSEDYSSLLLSYMSATNTISRFLAGKLIFYIPCTIEDYPLFLCYHLPKS
ncbi:unnamed protein product [Protopolystoma xenopodis]|uniref:Uncharacterized protein n=1 Tax=Protopolystoma xenopodis TaxID=117903 RepID=A0A448XBG8_9PLAT|nr:unnamed protein product [Protopolystoma xenopodis]